MRVTFKMFPILHYVQFHKLMKQPSKPFAQQTSQPLYSHCKD